MLIAKLRPSVLCAISVLSLGLFGVSQTLPESKPRDIQVCELLKNPELFDEQLVRFRGQLAFEFEGDTVDDADCSMPFSHTSIWWSYGGDPLPARQNKKITPLVLPILRDTSFQTFDEHARLRRTMLPDRQPCSFRKECDYYDVAAIFTGRFFARGHQRQLGPGGGYGHMGCCHLFVIEQISDVAVQRTPVPSDGQVFSCTTTEWQSEYPVSKVSSIDDRVDHNRQFLMDQARSQGDGLLADIMRGSSAWQFVGLTGSLVWHSPDLLTTYTVTFPRTYLTLKKNRPKQTEPSSPVPPLMTVSRERCEAIGN